MRIVAQDLTYTYNAKSPFASQALCGVTLTIEEGEFFGIIGHTGSGKSTFVQHLNALIRLTGGSLKVGEYDLADKKCKFLELRSKVGMVFQYPEYQLFAETVEKDVMFGLKNFAKDMKEEEMKAAVREALEIVDLNYAEIKDKSPFELSGGQKRRVAIAGVIVTKPEVLILDEPAAGLDPLGKKEVMQLLHAIHGKWCKTIVIVFARHGRDQRKLHPRRGVCRRESGDGGQAARTVQEGRNARVAGTGRARDRQDLYALKGAGHRNRHGFFHRRFYRQSSRAVSAFKRGHMLNDVTFGQYYPAKSFVHNMDARAKIVFVIAYIVAIFLADNFIALGAVTLFLIFIVLLSRVPFGSVLRSVKMILFLIVFTAILNLFFYSGESAYKPLVDWWIITITQESLVNMAFLALRLFLLVMGTSVLTLTTTPVSLTDGIESLLTPLKWIRFPVHELALIMSIALRFIPTLTDETNRIISAQKARGANFETGGLIKRAKATLPILIPLLVSAFRRAEDLGDAMDARCYSGAKGRTKYKKLTFTWRDLLGLLVLGGLITGIVFINLYFGNEFAFLAWFNK